MLCVVCGGFVERERESSFKLPSAILISRVPKNILQLFFDGGTRIFPLFLP